jgi:hypothetical protein
MAESKITATDRLRKEGRWEEASLWRDDMRKQLRAEGHTKAKANEASWQAMTEAFPPLPTSPDEPSDTVELLELDNYDSQPDMSRDILWVYENLARKGVAAEDAPGLGAWGLLQWARKFSNRFFEQVLPKARAVEKEAEEDINRKEDEEQIADIRERITEMHLEWEQEAVAGMDETLRKTVTSRMKGWQEQFHLDLAADAREGLLLRILRIVKDAVGAVTKHQAGS